MKQPSKHLTPIDPQKQQKAPNMETPSTSKTQAQKYSTKQITPRHIDISKYSRTKYFKKQRSPSKSPNKGRLSPTKINITTPHYEETITKEEADRKVRELQQWGSNRETKRFEMVLKARQEERRILRQKPEIGQTSKYIFKELQQKKHLSTNLIQRFEQYEHQKAQRLIDNLINTHLSQTNSVPTLRNLLRSNRQDLVSLLRSYSKEDLQKNT